MSGLQRRKSTLSRRRQELYGRLHLSEFQEGRRTSTANGLANIINKAWFRVILVVRFPEPIIKYITEQLRLREAHLGKVIDIQLYIHFRNLGAPSYRMSVSFGMQ